MEARHGVPERVWIADRGMASAENLAWLRQTGRRYIIGAPKSELKNFGSERLCKAVVTDEQIARYVGVDRKTIHNWQVANPELFAARVLKHGLKPPARPRRFRPEYCELARKLCELGVLTLEVAKLLGVHRSNFDRWRHQYPAFADAVESGMAAASQPRTKEGRRPVT